MSNVKSVFKIGDKVTVLRKVEATATWTNSWIPDMDAFVGKTFIVSKELTNDGIYDNSSGYWFPEESLELVSDRMSIKEAKEKIYELQKFINDYDMITADMIRPGNQFKAKSGNRGDEILYVMEMIGSDGDSFTSRWTISGAKNNPFISFNQKLYNFETKEALVVWLNKTGYIFHRAYEVKL